MTPAEVFTRLAQRIVERQHAPFEYIVVDEAQDLSVPSSGSWRRWGPTFPTGSSSPATWDSGSSSSRSPGTPLESTSVAARVPCISTTGRLTRYPPAGGPSAGAGARRRGRQRGRAEGHRFGVQRSGARGSGSRLAGGRDEGRWCVVCAVHSGRAGAPRDWHLASAPASCPGLSLPSSWPVSIPAFWTSIPMPSVVSFLSGRCTSPRDWSSVPSL